MDDNLENLKNLQDDILDQYNEEKISEKEMQNIMKWCEKQKKLDNNSFAQG